MKVNKVNRFHFSILILCALVGWVSFDQSFPALESADAQAGATVKPLPQQAFRISPDKQGKALYLAGDLAKDRVLLVGERGLILLSTDRGRSFEQVIAPTRRLLSDVLLRHDGIAIAVGHESTVLRSTDGGEKWQVVHHDPEQDLALFSISDAGNGNLVAVGAFGLVLVSSDDGLTWEQKLVSEDGPHLYSVRTHSDGLVTVGEFGSIYSSRDQGQSWNPLPSPYEGTLFDILIMKDRWILMGLRGNLWEGSASEWSQIRHGSEATLFGGAMLSDETIVVVGAEGVTLVRSPESGEWKHRVIREDDRRLLSAPLPLLDDSVLGLGEKGYRFVLGHGGSNPGTGEER
mgnify:CR=1 FL=1